MYTSATLIRRSAFDAAGGYDETLEAYEDWDLYLRLALRHRLVYSDCVTARYRIWAGNVSWERTAAGVVRVAEKHLDLLAQLPPAEQEAARYALLRRLAQSNHILLERGAARRAALKALRMAPLHGLSDAAIRGPLVRSLLPLAVLRRRRPPR
jgi:hypothetical protein